MESHSPIMNVLIVLVSIVPWSADSWLTLRLMYHEIGSLRWSLWLSWEEKAVMQLHFGLVGVLIESEAFSVAHVISSSCQLCTRFRSLDSGGALRFIVAIHAAYCCWSWFWTIDNFDFSGQSSLACVYSFDCIPEGACFEIRSLKRLLEFLDLG